MDCFVKRYLGLLKIGNVIVGSIKELDIEVLSVKGAGLKLLKVELEDIGWDILNLLLQFPMYGI